jgi:hypothetical protein
VEDLIAHGRRKEEDGVVIFYNDSGFGGLSFVGLNEEGDVAFAG